MAITMAKLDKRVTKLEEDLDAHSEILVDIRERLERVERKQNKHTATLDEHGRKLDEHGQKLDEHGQKLDEILQILRAA